MKVRELIEQLQTCDPEQSVVVSVYAGDDFYELHNCVLQSEGHIGFRGPIIHIMSPLETETEAAKVSK